MLRKLCAIVLPLAIWITMIVYHGIVLKPFSDFMLNVSAPFALSFTLHTLVQLLIICTAMVAAVKKFSYEIKHLIISIIILYFLFAIYSPPSIYMFAFTGGWSILYNNHPAMPSWIASIFITLQYGVVMLITTLIVSRKNDGGNRT